MILEYDFSKLYTLFAYKLISRGMIIKAIAAVEILIKNIVFLFEAQGQVFVDNSVYRSFQK
jgi:hypothetical protein